MCVASWAERTNVPENVIFWRLDHGWSPEDAVSKTKRRWAPSTKSPEEILKSTYRSMIYRCYNPNANNWDYYGGRGIKVCARWRGPKGFENFKKDMGYRPPGMSLDRIDSNKDYSPRNCRWSTKTMQAAGMRRARVLDFNGKRQTVNMWAKELGMSHRALSRRLRIMSVEEALTLPKYAQIAKLRK
jgi:hypothetical protein